MLGLQRNNTTLTKLKKPLSSERGFLSFIFE
jgi:hypothetical protein